MRAITVDNELVEFDDSIAYVQLFKEKYRSVAFEEDDYPEIVLIDPSTYEEMQDNAVMHPQVLYLLVVLTETLLHQAVEKNYILLVEFLIKNAYADVDATDDDDRTALSYCTDPDLCTMLIQSGAEVNHSDIQGNSVMHHMLTALIAEMSNMSNIERMHSIVRTLHVLSWNGADPDAENDDDISCREMYHAVFPETQANDEDGELREFFSSANRTSPTLFSCFNSSSSVCSSASSSAFDLEMEME